MMVLLYKEWNKVNFYFESGGDYSRTVGQGIQAMYGSHGRSLGWGLGGGGGNARTHRFKL
jgi:hypothetical protein